uniref:AlNc14C3G523 protein n=1 Tax=Albugo laibachii Nc14 TaxID=890382 RepID=F0W055_9STRA|nr:AlNc14C3G523 [Albugo laibachii Nc14]|eukprot:CCA14426.1 AlNc14C3G523 [Albugo laibachii Nc14]
MTTASIQCSLARFNERTHDLVHHVLLLLDNASPHRVSEQFSSVMLHFITPTTSLHLQPQDVGIIQSLKRQMNKIRNAYVVEKLDELLERMDGMGKANVEINGEQLFNVNILVAMRWAQEA